VAKNQKPVVRTFGGNKYYFRQKIKFSTIEICVIICFANFGQTTRHGSKIESFTRIELFVKKIMSGPKIYENRNSSKNIIILMEEKSDES